MQWGEGGAAAEAAASATPHTDLQRGDGLDDDSTCEVTEHDLRQDTDRDTRRQRERLERRLGDARLVAELRQSGFTGPKYDELERELVRYGWAVMDAWLRRGFIFGLAARLRRPVKTTDALRQVLAEDHEERKELAAAAVAATVSRFRQDALVGGGWSAERGASLTTYFMNAVTREFPNEYRRWMTHQMKWRRQFNAEGRTYDPTPDPTTDPAAVATSREQVLADLRRLKPREQHIVALTLDGYSQEEIVELLHEGSVREVEGVMYRWRTREKRQRKTGGAR